LVDAPAADIDYSDNPPTSKADWEDAEVLFPVSAEELEAIKRFIRERRLERADPQTR
jgi:hypothetical protein